MSIVNEENQYAVHVRLVEGTPSLGNPPAIIEGFLRVGLSKKQCNEYADSIYRAGHFGCPAGQIFLFNREGTFTTVVGSNVVKNSIIHIAVRRQDA